MLNRTNTRGVIPEWISNHYNNIKIIIQLIYWSLRLSSYITSFKIFLKFPEDVCGSLSKHVEYQKLPIVQLAGSKCVYIKMTRKIYNMTVLDTRVWSMIMVCPHAKFHIPGSSSFFFSKTHQTISKEIFSQGCPNIMLYEVLLLRETADIWPSHIFLRAGKHCCCQKFHLLVLKL